MSEPSGSTLNPVPVFVSNAEAPQIADYGLLAGAALIIASAITPQGRANASEYTFGTHAQAVHQAEGLKSQVWGSVRTPPAAAAAPIRSIWAAPQQADLTQQAIFAKTGLPTGRVPATAIGTAQTDPTQLTAQVWKSATASAAILGPTVSPNAPVPPQFDPSVNPSKLWPSAVTPQGQANAAQYSFGTHALATHQDETLKSMVWKSAQTPPAPSTPMPLRSLWASPELADLSISGWSIGGTLTTQGPVPPISLAPPQTDPTQIAPIVWKSQPIAPLSGRVPPQTRGAPQTDPSQLAPQIWESVPTPPAITGVTVWPAIMVPAQFDTTPNPTALWTPGTFSPGAPIPPAPDVSTNVIRNFSLIEWRRWRRPEDEREIRKRRLTPAVAEVIADVAERQAERLEADEHKRLEELTREIELKGLRWEGRYLELLNIERQQLIDAEIASLMQQKQADLTRSEEESILLFLMTL